MTIKLPVLSLLCAMGALSLGLGGCNTEDSEARASALAAELSARSAQAEAESAAGRLGALENRMERLARTVEAAVGDMALANTRLQDDLSALRADMAKARQAAPAGGSGATTEGAAASGDPETSYEVLKQQMKRYEEERAAEREVQRQEAEARREEQRVEAEAAMRQRVEQLRQRYPELDPDANPMENMRRLLKTYGSGETYKVMGEVMRDARYRQLGLSATTSERLAGIENDYYGKRLDVYEREKAGTLTPQAAASEKEALKKQYEASLAGTLTPEELQKFNEAPGGNTGGRGRGGMGGMGGMGGNPMAAMSEPERAIPMLDMMKNFLPDQEGGTPNFPTPPRGGNGGGQDF